MLLLALPLLLPRLVLLVVALLLLLEHLLLGLRVVLLETSPAHPPPAPLPLLSVSVPKPRERKFVPADPPGTPTKANPLAGVGGATEPLQVVSIAGHRSPTRVGWNAGTIILRNQRVHFSGYCTGFKSSLY